MTDVSVGAGRAEASRKPERDAQAAAEQGADPQFREGPTDGRPLPAVVGRTKWQARYARNLAITDSVVVCAAVGASQYLRFGPDTSWPSAPDHYVMTFSAVFALGWMIALAVFHTRSPRLIGTGIEEYRRVVAASLWVFGAIAIVTLLLKLDVARGYLAYALPGGIVGLVVSRALWRRFVRHRRLNGEYRTAVLAIGDREAVTNIARELTRDSSDGYRVVGVSIPGYGPPRGEHLDVRGSEIPIVGDEGYALRAIPIWGADTVAISNAEHFGLHGLRRLIWNLEPLGVDLVMSTGVTDIALSRLVMRPSPALPLLHVEKPQYRGAKQLGKRAFDVCFATLALVAVSPLMVAVALAVKATSRGPVFYASERIGIDGRPFFMLKFRTMVDGADNQVAALIDRNEGNGLLFKMRDDPRVTPVGRILRRLSIDELPQFLNVLRSEMSVVGPRPPLRREVEAYDYDVRHRLLVKPGVTGLWQVSGRSDLSWDEAVRLDLFYVDNWSMVVDLVIIAKTLRAVSQRKGAY
ncbi:sugar transferase [Mycolicibacterium vaccae]|uniref:sugar transferase n=1 Tax=Mycolicibacterium vaccae TaxID=1810 RepID=UPI003D0731CF